MDFIEILKDIMIDFGDDTSTESLDKTENETFDKDLSVDEFDANSLFGDNDFDDFDE